MQWPNHSLSELFTYLAHRVPERQLPNDPRIHAHCVLVCEGVCIEGDGSFGSPKSSCDQGEEEESVRQLAGARRN